MLEQPLDVEEGHNGADEIEDCESGECVNSKVRRKQEDDCGRQQQQPSQNKNCGRNSPEQNFGGSDFGLLPFNGEKFAAVMKRAKGRAPDFADLGDETWEMIVRESHISAAPLASAD